MEKNIESFVEKNKGLIDIINETPSGLEVIIKCELFNNSNVFLGFYREMKRFKGVWQGYMKHSFLIPAVISPKLEVPTQNEVKIESETQPPESPRLELGDAKTYWERFRVDDDGKRIFDDRGKRIKTDIKPILSQPETAPSTKHE
jgi:hypothetical protein